MSKGQGGGRVYTVRNVDVDIREWTGRVMLLENTLGRNRQDARFFHIPPTLILLRKSHFTSSLPETRLANKFLRENNLHL